MKNVLRVALKLSCFFCCFFFLSATAQTIKSDDIIVNQWAPESVKIDGQLADWGDSLKYYNESTRFSFNVANDNKTIYLGIKSHNKENLNRILARGISFSINTEGKKKPGATVIFPVVARTSPPNKSVDRPQDAQQLHKQAVNKIQQILVTGFPEILDGPISINNTYGISAAADFDIQDNLTMEVAIPFHLLGITADQNLLSCLIEINGIKPPRSTYDPNQDQRRRRMYGYPSRDYRYERGPVVNKQNLATGFWIKTTLAKNNQ